MTIFNFTVPYTEKGEAKVSVEADSLEEALLELEEGNIEDCYDTDVGSVKYESRMAVRYGEETE